MNNIELYYREYKVPFNAIHFTKKDINTRTGTILNFYQKNILLILSKGLVAKDTDDLSNKLSTMLNIKYSVIKEYIEYLYKLNAIVLSNGKFTISGDLNYTYSDKHQDIMVANTKLGKDVLSYIYLLEAGTLLTQKILDDNKITSTEKVSANNYEGLIPALYSQLSKLNEEQIPLNLAKESLNNTVCDECYIRTDDLEDLYKSEINIPFKIEYSYNRETEKGEFQNCYLNLEDNSIIHKYLLAKNFNMKISKQFEEDTKKPDYILYEEAVVLENEKRKKLEKAQKESEKIKQEKTKTHDEIGKVKEELEKKNEKLKSLKKELKELREDNKEYQNKLKDIVKEEKSKIIVSDNLKELNIKDNELNSKESRTTKKIQEITKDILASHEGLYSDSFEKKLYTFENRNNKLYKTYPNIYKENFDIINILLSMSKKINNNSNMVKEWFNLYPLFTCYLKFLLSIMLSRRPETIDSFRSEIGDSLDISVNNRFNLGIKYNFSGENCEHLILLERCSDHIRHSFDSIQHTNNYKKSNSNNADKQEVAYEKFKSLTKEEKKDVLYSIIYFIEKANLNDNDIKLLDNMIITNYDKTIN